MNYMIVKKEFPEGIQVSWPEKTYGYELAVCSDTIQMVSRSNLKIYQMSGALRCNLQIPTAESAHSEAAASFKQVAFNTDFAFSLASAPAESSHAFVSPDGKRLVVHYPESGRFYVHYHANSVETPRSAHPGEASRLLAKPDCFVLPDYARSGRFICRGIHSTKPELYFHHIASDMQFSVQAINYNTGACRKVVEFASGEMHAFDHDHRTNDFFCIIRSGSTRLLGASTAAYPVILDCKPVPGVGVRHVIDKVLVVHPGGVDTHDRATLRRVASAEFKPGPAAPQESSFEPAQVVRSDQPLIKHIVHAGAGRLFLVETDDGRVHIFDIHTGNCTVFNGIKDPAALFDTVDARQLIWTDAAGIHVAHVPLCVIYALHKPDRKHVLCFLVRGRDGECVVCTRGFALSNLMFRQDQEEKLKSAMAVYHLKTSRPCAGCSDCKRSPFPQ